MVLHFLNTDICACMFLYVEARDQGGMNAAGELRVMAWLKRTTTVFTKDLVLPTTKLLLLIILHKKACTGKAQWGNKWIKNCTFKNTHLKMHGNLYFRVSLFYNTIRKTRTPISLPPAYPNNSSLSANTNFETLEYASGFCNIDSNACLASRDSVVADSK